MPEIDLRALSEPIEELKGELHEAYKTLDSKWERITNQLKRLSIPTDVAYCFWCCDRGTERNSCIEWRKWNGARKICLGFYESFADEDGPHTIVPYDEWSGQQRIEMLDHVPKLFERAAQCTRDFIKQINREEVTE